MKASCSMFSQILKLIPHTDFERIAKETGAQYRSKGLSSWSQFVGMLFCQLGRAHSPAGNRRRAEELRRQTGPPGHSGAGPLVALIRQWPSSVATVREGVLRVVRHRCRQGGGQEEISAQEQAGEPRLHRDRPVPVAV